MISGRWELVFSPDFGVSTFKPGLKEIFDAACSANDPLSEAASGFGLFRT